MARAGEEAVRPVAGQPAPDFARLLQQLRAENGLTQEELAEAAGLSPRTVSDLERGIHRSARQNTVRLLADALDLAEPVRGLFIATARGRLPTAQVPADHQDAPAAWVARTIETLSAAAVPVPRELPADVSAFTGRSAELARLDALIPVARRGARRGPVLISAVSGTAGAGKTALAVRWAHRAAGRFPDGQLYVNLRGYDVGRPVSAAEALAGFLRALGVSNRDIPVEEAERATRYRSLLAGRRMLVVLDNAAAEEQVRPLLPGAAGVMVVVTSRDSLPGLVARDGALRLDLDVLPAADAITLLRALIGERVDADPIAARTLAEQCARLPLALRVAAELAAARPYIPLAEMAAELACEERRLDLLDAGGDRRAAIASVFSWSYHQLPAAAARMFRMLGLHPGPDFDCFAAAALTGTGTDEAGQLLGMLTRAHLVQPIGPQRFGMHDLLHAYAARLASAHDRDQVRQAAQTRLFDYYLAAVMAAMNVLDPVERHYWSFDVPSETIVPELAGPLARTWLDAERATLVAVVAYTAGHDWPGHTYRLATALSRYLDGGYHAEALAIYTHAEQAARASGDHTAQLRNLTRIADTYFWQARYRQAADLYQRALAAARKVDDRYRQSAILNRIGVVREQQGHYRQAAECHEQNWAMSRELGDTVAEVIALDNLGTVHLRQGRYQLGLQYQQRALALYRQLAPADDAAVLLPADLGGDHDPSSAHQQIVVHYQRHIALSRQLGDRYGEADTLIRLGQISHRQGWHEQSLACHQEALALLQDAGDRSKQADALNGAGECLLASSQHSQARACHAAALTLARETGNRQQEGRALAGLATVDLLRGDHRQAISSYRQATSLFRDSGDKGGETGALIGTGECLLAADDPAHARSYHLAALALACDTGDRYQQVRAHQCLADDYRADHRHEQARAHERNALEICAELYI